MWLNKLFLSLSLSLYTAIQGEIATEIPTYVHNQTSHTHSHHEIKFIPPSTSSDTYKYSFLPRTIVDWNSLPPDVATSGSVPAFKKASNNSN